MMTEMRWRSVVSDDGYDDLRCVTMIIMVRYDHCDAL